MRKTIIFIGALSWLAGGVALGRLPSDKDTSPSTADACSKFKSMPEPDEAAIKTCRNDKSKCLSAMRQVGQKKAELLNSCGQVAYEPLFKRTWDFSKCRRYVGAIGNLFMRCMLTVKPVDTVNGNPVETSP